MNPNLFWCIVGTIGGAIVGCIINLFFYIIGLTRKRIAYDIKTMSIVSNKVNQINGLEVKYYSIEIDNLYSSIITIKNMGNSIIKEGDFAPSCPLSILTSGQFLNAKIEKIQLNKKTEQKQLNKNPNFNLELKGDGSIFNKLQVHFDYIPKEASITFSAFHTGEIHFIGDLMEGKIVTLAEPQQRKKITKILANILSIIVCIGVLSIILVLYFLQ